MCVSEVEIIEVRLFEDFLSVEYFGLIDVNAVSRRSKCVDVVGEGHMQRRTLFGLH